MAKLLGYLNLAWINSPLRERLRREAAETDAATAPMLHNLAVTQLTELLSVQARALGICHPRPEQLARALQET